MMTPEQRERTRITQRTWYRKNRERCLLYQKEWHRKNRERKLLDFKAYYAENLKHLATIRRTERANTRAEVLSAYGDRCTCCGEDRPQFLTIDHIDSSGAAHRRVIQGGSGFYRWLRKHGFPKDNFQLLCFNCNLSKGHYGACPHMVEKIICA